MTDREPESSPAGVSYRTTLAVLGPLVVLGALTTDLFLPALPDIARELGSDRQLAQLSVGAALIGVAAGQLVGGALSDQIGRRVPLLVGAGVHVVASVGIALCSDMATLLGLRVVQGAGAAAASVVAMAVARDLASGARLVRLLARLALFSGLAPVAAPFLGSGLLHAVHWRGLFVVLAVYGVLVAVLCAALLPETRDIHQPRTRQLARYRAVLTDRVFLGAAVLGSMACTGVFAYVASSAFVLRDGFGLDADLFAIVFAVNAAAFALGSQLASRLVAATSPRRALVVALPPWLISGAALIVCEVTSAPVGGFLAASFAFLVAAGATMPVVQVLGMASHGARAGTAASALGAINFAAPGLLSPLTAAAAPGPIAALGVSITAAGVVGTIALLTMARHSSRGEARGAAIE
ncbi:multidrug effflux MFS transporter [Schumannella luteola]|uniref:DHA1 family bicyclomycin/chloramphenicol resistance-like MFS transporter n=1 Tax=Schumannella luteola TaxID=472059 RepID=A0A852YH54_9MICO|nr:DHA1 family bicyclomycin/chloramphenicol resistance-like MFS transporter [Schumannella luteola]